MILLVTHNPIKNIFYFHSFTVLTYCCSPTAILCYINPYKAEILRTFRFTMVKSIRHKTKSISISPSPNRETLHNFEMLGRLFDNIDSVKLCQLKYNLRVT